MKQIRNVLKRIFEFLSLFCNIMVDFVFYLRSAFRTQRIQIFFMSLSVLFDGKIQIFRPNKLPRIKKKLRRNLSERTSVIELEMCVMIPGKLSMEICIS